MIFRSALFRSLATLTVIDKSSIIKRILFSLVVTLFFSLAYSQSNVPDLGLRAAWMRGTYGLNWKPGRSANGNSEGEDFTIVNFLDQIKDIKTVDYIQVHLNESSVYSPVHVGPHPLIESFWEGDTDESGNPINLVVPRASIGRDPFLDIITNVRAAGLKVQVYVNSSNMMRRSGLDSPDEFPDVTNRWIEWCDTNPTAQAFINSQSYHKNGEYDDSRPYMFCYAEFILKEYAIRYGDLIDAWCFDSGRYMWQYSGDSSDSDYVEDQRVYQAFADACHVGNPNAAISFQNSPGEGEPGNPFTPATLFCDYMFGHPFNGGKNVGSNANNQWIIDWAVTRDGYAHIDDGRDRIWDDKVVGHYDPPMSTTKWNTGSDPGVDNYRFADYYGSMILGNGAVSFGIPLNGRYNFENGLMSQDWAIEQLDLLDAYLVLNQNPEAPNWARQFIALPDADQGDSFLHVLVEGVDFWAPEGEEITALRFVNADDAPSWLSISETDTGTWVLSGIPDEYADYSFMLQAEIGTGVTTDQQVTLKVVESGIIPVNAVTVYPGFMTIAKEETLALTALTIPSNATEQEVIWSSDDTNIATVDESGKVTARNIGSVTITATTVDGGYASKCALTISEVTDIVEVESLVTLFPNPANNSLNFDFRDINKVYNVAVYSLSGKLMFIQEIESNTGQLDISGLQSGIYLMEINGDETIMTKFVKE